MSSKVTCSSCGHSWNKSDSSKKDANVCHICGKDNTMKDGGWLDKYNDGGPIQPNYNDSSVSTPEGFLGDGYSNVGRNYSPAWGGQFDDGGELPNVTVKGKRQPIVVTTPNDPRLKAYQDSLAIYNLASQEYRELKKTGKLADLDINVDSEKKYSFKDYIDEYNRPISDFNAFNSGTNSKMKPITVSQFRGKGILGYLDYGRQAQYKKPERPVILNTDTNTKSIIIPTIKSKVSKKPKPQPTPQSTIDFMEGNYAQEPIAQEPIIEAPQQSATSWGQVVDPRTGYRHLTRQGVPMYPLVGQRVPEMAMGGSLPGATGSMYARVGAPSKGPHRNQTDVTDASAQNGAEMKYYQNGLDWKPKSISRDGDNVAYADNTRVGNVPRYTRPSNYQGNQPDTLGENIFEIVDPSSISSWDDIYRSYNQTGMSGQTAMEAVGAIPMLGNMGKLTKAGIHLKKYQGLDKTLYKTLPKNKILSGALSGAAKAGRGSDAYQAYDQYKQGGQLTKLDQSLNFTNYNKPTKGGWLDKYK